MKVSLPRGVPSMADASNQSIEKLSLVIASGEFEKVHYALVMAAGAAAIGIPVTLFFTMSASVTVLEGDGWRQLVSEKENVTASERDTDFAQKGVATMDELIESCHELGVTFLVCEMGLRAEGLEDTPSIQSLNVERTGVVTFLNDASPEGSIIYI